VARRLPGQHAGGRAGQTLIRELELTYGECDDHAEGIGLIGPAEAGRLLVVYDSPAAARMTADGAVVADVVRLPAHVTARTSSEDELTTTTE